VSFVVVLVILFAAFLHAFWNYLVRGTEDKVLGMAAVVFGHAPLALLGLLWVGLPSMSALPYIIASTLLHVGYQSFLMNSYKFGTLTQIYPIARGSAPLIIALITVVLSADVLKLSQVLGIFIISFGILAHGVLQYRNENFNLKGLLLALTTGGFIAAYSVVDGAGTRVIENSVSYYGALTIGNCFLFSIYLKIFHRGVMGKIVKEAKFTFFIGGGTSYLAYVLVLWACLHLPIAVVSSLRETSVLFALLIGVIFLKEKITLQKVFVIFIILFGIMVLRLT